MFVDEHTQQLKLARLSSSAAQTLLPAEFGLPSDWADARRVMPKDGPRGPVRWRTDLVPYAREPLNAFADPDVETIVLLFPAQTSKTEILFSAMGWMFESKPRPCIYMTPGEALARSLSKKRLHEMLTGTPELARLLDGATNKPGSLERYINGTRFGMTWAGSRFGAASHPCAWAIVDELSLVELDETQASDPVTQIEARLKNYFDSKLALASTPGDVGFCPTHGWWLTGTKLRWCWTCPECGLEYPPMLEHLGYPAGDYDRIRAEAWIACPECGHHVTDDTRRELPARYVSYDVDEEGKLHQLAERPEGNRCASYWVTGPAGAFVGIGQLAEKYVRARHAGKERHVRDAVTLWWGELYQAEGSKIDSDAVKARQVVTVPAEDVQLITAGVDVQKDCLYYVVRAWCPYLTSYLAAHGKLIGPSEYDDVWLALRRVLSDTFYGLPVRKVLIDSGYNTSQVYAVARRNGFMGWAPAKGVDRSNRPYYDTLVDETASGRALKRLKLWIYCSDTWKTHLRARITWPEDEPGGWFVPKGIDDEYCRQVTNERVRTINGRRKWVATGTQENHYGDAEVLATVAAHLANVRALRPGRPRTEQPSSPPASPADSSGPKRTPAPPGARSPSPDTSSPSSSDSSATSRGSSSRPPDALGRRGL